MRTSSFFILVLFCSIFFLTSCEKDPIDIEPIPDLPQTSAQFKNTSHEAFGAATLKVQNNQLTTDNIGSSGQDGVNIFLPPNQSSDIFFQPVTIPDGGSMTVGAVNRQNPNPYSAMRLSKKGEETVFEAYTGHGKPVTVTAYFEGNVVHQETMTAGGKSKAIPWLAVAVGWYVLDHVSAHVDWSEKDGWSAGVDWNGKANNGNTYAEGSAVAMNFESIGEPIEVDAIMVSTLGDETYDPTSDEYALQLKAKELEKFTITEEIFYTPKPHVPNPTVPHWILTFGQYVAGSSQCEGFGFCNSTFTPTPFDIEKLAYNQVLVNKGEVTETSDGNLMLKITNENNGMNDYLLKTAKMIEQEGVYHNPSDFVLPQEFVQAVFENANLEAPELLLLPLGTHPGEVIYDPTGILLGIRVTVTVKIGILTVTIVIDIC